MSLSLPVFDEICPKMNLAPEPHPTPSSGPLGPGLRLRRAQQDDIEAIVEICARCFPASLRWVSGTEPPRRWLRAAIASEISEGWIVEDEHSGTILCSLILVLDERRWAEMKPIRRLSFAEACAAAIREPKRIWIKLQEARRPIAPTVGVMRKADRYDPSDRIFAEQLVTAPAAQGRGIGKRMLAYSLDRARDLGKSGVACIVHPKNPVIKLHHGLGFGITGQEAHGLLLSAPASPPVRQR